MKSTEHTYGKVNKFQMTAFQEGRGVYRGQKFDLKNNKGKENNLDRPKDNFFLIIQENEN